MNKTLEAVEQAKQQLAEAEKALKAERARRQIMCSCGKRHAIGKLELLVTHWYEGPHGCTGGDCWHPGEWQFVCPTTNMVNRLMFDDYDVKWDERGRIGIAAGPTFQHLYWGLFASKRDTYDRSGGPFVPTFSNYDVDQNRARFELPAKRKKAVP